MKRKKIIFLLLFPLICEVIVSCCNCPDPVIKYYTNKTLTVNHLDNKGSGPVVTAADSAVRTAYGLRIQMTREKIAYMHKRSSLFLQSAYAYKCDCGPLNQILPRDSVIDIKIITVNNFDATHPANTDVAALFRVYNNFAFSTIDEYLKVTRIILYTDSELELKIDLLLMSPPPTYSQQRFRVQMILSDGRTLEQETTQIRMV